MIPIDQLIKECDEQTSCFKCKHYNECLNKYKYKTLTSEKNNPSTINAEIKGFDFNLYSDKNTPENFKVNICEANQYIINKALISLFQVTDNVEIANIMKAALEKFSVDPNNSAQLFKSKDKYHLVFECVDCTAINDSTEYINGDSITIYCKYCGKRHKFNINKEN